MITVLPGKIAESSFQNKICALVFLLQAMCPSAFAQVFPYANEAHLGDETFTPGLLDRRMEPYGVRSPMPEGPALSTRHQRFGDRSGISRTGIGGSFLGTESVTAESRPISAPVSGFSGQVVPFQEFKPRTFSETMMYSPALTQSPFSTTLQGEFSPSIGGYSQNNTTTGLESASFNELWGHQRRKTPGSFEPLTGTSPGLDSPSK